MSVRRGLLGAGVTAAVTVVALTAPAIAAPGAVDRTATRQAIDAAVKDGVPGATATAKRARPDRTETELRSARLGPRRRHPGLVVLGGHHAGRPPLPRLQLQRRLVGGRRRGARGGVLQGLRYPGPGLPGRDRPRLPHGRAPAPIERPAGPSARGSRSRSHREYRRDQRIPRPRDSGVNRSDPDMRRAVHLPETSMPPHIGQPAVHGDGSIVVQGGWSCADEARSARALGLRGLLLRWRPDPPHRCRPGSAGRRSASQCAERPGKCSVRPPGRDGGRRLLPVAHRGRRGGRHPRPHVRSAGALASDPTRFTGPELATTARAMAGADVILSLKEQPLGLLNQAGLPRRPWWSGCTARIRRTRAPRSAN